VHNNRGTAQEQLTSVMQMHTGAKRLMSHFVLNFAALQAGCTKSGCTSKADEVCRKDLPYANL
jgi:hypothetical protein